MIIHVNFPANDNTLGGVRPLAPEDVAIIAEEHALVLGCTVDQAVQYPECVNNYKNTILLVLEKFPELQRDIVWRGSWLKRPEVDRLQAGGSLFTACVEVIVETRAHYEAGELEEIVIAKLKRFSNYLRDRSF